MRAEPFKRCTKCVLSAGFPRIEFDIDGICNFCQDKMFFTSEQRAIDKARGTLSTLIAEKRGMAEYDAVVCFSGGKDSTYTLMLAVEKYGLKVLSFTLDNGFISDTATSNINKTVDMLGVDHVTVKPAARFFKKLIKVSAIQDIYHPKSLQRISSGCNSCISMVQTTALKLALEKNIPFIVSGFTFGQIPLNAVIFKNNYRFLQESRAPVIEKLAHYLGDDVAHYFSLSDDLLKSVVSFPHNINLLCIEEVAEQDILKSVAEIGWKHPSDVDGCSSNCRLNTFNNYIHNLKYGYHPYELELSHLIRKGQMTRSEAIAKIDAQPLDALTEIMHQLDLRPDEIKHLMPESPP